MPFYEIIDTDLNRIKGKTISIIGGGGKSTLLQQIGKELVEKDFRVILTTTTKLQPLPNIGLVLQNGNQKFISELRLILKELRIALVAREFYQEDKLRGVGPAFAGELKKFADVVLIEADGSRQRPLKTHKEYEPVIPVTTDSVIIICGAEVVGQPLNESNVHRYELFAQKWGIPFDTVLTPEIIVKELLSPYGYLSNIPIHSNISILINKADKNPIGAKTLAETLAQKCDYPIFLGSLEENLLERI